MGRHSQTSSVSTTLAGLGMLVQRGVSRDAGSRAHRAEGSSVAPVMLRAGGAAAALALAVSGGAYAAVGASAEKVRPLTETRAQMAAIGSTDDVTVTAGTTTLSTVTEEATDPYTTVEEQTPSLPVGQRQVKTAGVNGVTRTTYQVTTVDGVETAREAVSTVVVSARVDEVVLVGTGTGTDADSAKAIARTLVAERGWGEEQFSCLDRLWTRESHWNYQARNSSSGAYGIPQALPGSKMGSVASDWQTNPTTQITWGLGYIAGRYGNPCAAWAHSEATGWY